MFQSAPRTPARGDLSLANSFFRIACFNPRPAHLRGATFQSTKAWRGWFVFQSAPRTPARGDSENLDWLASQVVSIRAPHTCAGRPKKQLCGRRLVQVSIRAPHTCAGRLRAFLSVEPQASPTP